jgi:hypothetical protein
MRSFEGAKRLSICLAVAALMLLPVSVLAQEQGAGLTLQQVKERLKENKKFLEQASQRGKAGDAPGMQVALENYNRGTDGLNRAMASGRFAGDEFDREEAWQRVEKATRTHSEVLGGLLNKVPEQARPAIQHALEVSQRGRETALRNLQSARSERRAAEQRRAAQQPSIGRQPGQTGRPSGVGQPGGIGGRPANPGPPTSRPGKPGGRP